MDTFLGFELPSPPLFYWNWIKLSSPPLLPLDSPQAYLPKPPRAPAATDGALELIFWPSISVMVPSFLELFLATMNWSSLITSWLFSISFKSSFILSFLLILVVTSLSFSALLSAISLFIWSILHQCYSSDWVSITTFYFSWQIVHSLTSISCLKIWFYYLITSFSPYITRALSLLSLNFCSISARDFFSNST